MSTIVFLLEKYLPELDANVVCALNVIKQLQNEGHKIICICGTYNIAETVYIDGVAVYRVHRYKNRFEGFFQDSNKVGMLACKIMHYVKSILVLPLFPNIDPLFSRKLNAKLEEVTKHIKIDCIIGVFRPYAPICAIVRFKKKNQKAPPCIGYYLDILKAANKPFGAPKIIYEKLCDYKEKHIFKFLQRILVAEQGKEYYNSSYFAKYSSIIRYVNFPTLIPKDCVSFNKKETYKTFVYAGYMDKTYRNPTFLIKVFSELKDLGENVELHLYGTSNMDQELIDLSNKCKSVHYHGQVLKEEADYAICNADYVISLGNKIDGIVPSKIFELFGYKKPLLHVAPSDHDASLPYVRKYKASCIIDANISEKTAATIIKEFCSKSFPEITDEWLKQEFFSATPEAISREIEITIRSNNNA